MISMRMLTRRILSSSVVNTQMRSVSTVEVVKRDDGVANVTLNSPRTRNTLSLETMKTMIEEIRSLGEDQSVRSIVLRGEGKVFSSGHNLKELTPDSGFNHMEIFNTCERLMMLVSEVRLL